MSNNCTFTKEAPLTSTNQPHTHTHDNHTHGDHTHPTLSTAKGRDHGHTHEHLDSPGHYTNRAPIRARDYSRRAFTVGIGGPVGSGKTALVLQLCKLLK